MDENNLTKSEYRYIPAPPFVSTRREAWSGLISYVLAYLYLTVWFPPDGMYLPRWLLFCAGFTAWELWYTRDEAPAKEHWLWLAGLWICALSVVCATLNLPMGQGRIWEGFSWFFTHAYALYWVLCRSGRLIGGRSSGFVLLDLLNAGICWPFQHFFLRIRSLFYCLTHRKPRQRKVNPSRLGYGILAVLVGCGFLFAAVNLLSQADEEFGQIFNRFTALELWSNTALVDFGFRVLFSLPVGAYLNGLVTGTLRQSRELPQREGKAVTGLLTQLRKLPAPVWELLLGAFVVLYLSFFTFQSRYLFGALLGIGPEGGLTVAQYARQGFFELCKIMALNFALLWVIALTCETQLHRRPGLKLLSSALMGESILFAVTAFSKLALYISRYSFTPLRFQSAWGILVMLVGCICVLVQLWTEKKTAGFWVLFTGLSLAVTLLY